MRPPRTPRPRRPRRRSTSAPGSPHLHARRSRSKPLPPFRAVPPLDRHFRFLLPALCPLGQCCSLADRDWPERPPLTPPRAGPGVRRACARAGPPAMLLQSLVGAGRTVVAATRGPASTSGAWAGAGCVREAGARQGPETPGPRRLLSFRSWPRLRGKAGPFGGIPCAPAVCSRLGKPQ